MSIWLWLIALLLAFLAGAGFSAADNRVLRKQLDTLKELNEHLSSRVEMALDICERIVKACDDAKTSRS